MWRWLFLFWLGSSNAAVLPAATADWTVVNLTVAGQNRQALAYRPSHPNPALWLFFSGTGATLEFNTADELGRQTLLDFANLHGIAMLFPLPRVMDRGDWDNHSAGTPYWETAVAEGSTAAVSSSGNADLILAQTLIDVARTDWAVDSRRIYTLGFSNGAFFSYFVAQQLADRIAGFAATGGGLVLSGTTGGEPACQPSVTPGNIREVRSCSAAGWTPGSCSSAGAVPRPIAPGPGLPPAYLEANDDDNSVPYAHTCNLAAQLPTGSDVLVRIVHAGGGHIVNAGFLDNAWNMLRSRRLGDTTTVRDAERLFNWAEFRYGALFAPAGQTSQTFGAYNYRFYPGSQSYLAVSNGLVQYLLDQGSITTVGPLNSFIEQIVADGF